MEQLLNEHYGIGGGSNNNDATMLVLPPSAESSPEKLVMGDDSSLLESQYEVAKEADVRGYLLETMKIFDENYCYE